jgi:hypothetical protein
VAHHGLLRRNIGGKIVVANDASWDDSVEETLRRFPQTRVVRHEGRKGASPH